MKKQHKTKPSPFSIYMPRPGKTVRHSLGPQTSQQIEAVDAVKLFGLDSMDMTFDPAMINFRCQGNPANGFMPSLRGTFRTRHARPPTLDEQTERFLEEQFDDLFPTKTRKRHLPLLEQRDIAMREALGRPRKNKHAKNRRRTP